MMPVCMIVLKKIFFVRSIMRKGPILGVQAATPNFSQRLYNLEIQFGRKEVEQYTFYFVNESPT